MRRVRTEAHYGKPLTLEQCRRCGGIWFDDSELHQTKRGEAERIELIDSVVLRKPSPIQNSVLHCPKDQAKLIRFKEPGFPRELVVESCPVCRGFWLKRGEFLKFQRHLAENAESKNRRKAKRDAEDLKFEASVEKLLALHGRGRYDTLGRLAKFLSAPVDPLTLRPFESETFSPREKRALSFTLDILTAVLSFFLRK